jgi:hypothetical protein
MTMTDVDVDVVDATDAYLRRSALGVVRRQRNADGWQTIADVDVATIDIEEKEQPT